MAAQYSWCLLARVSSVFARMASNPSLCAKDFLDWIFMWNVFSSSGRDTARLSTPAMSEWDCKRGKDEIQPRISAYFVLSKTQGILILFYKESLRRS